MRRLKIPELPEVTTVKNSLLPIVGSTVIAVGKNNKIKMRGMSGNFSKLITSGRIEKITRRGKYILFYLESGGIVSHLGMTGRWTLTKERLLPSPKHCALSLTLQKSKREYYLYYIDARRFGQIHQVDDVKEHIRQLKLGPEPLGDNFTAEYLIDKLDGSEKPIKIKLMDQKVVVGIGNIYASEILYRCRIHPLTAATKISEDTLEKIVTVSKRVLREAIDHGGTTLRDYVTADGSEGQHQKHLQVYGREGQPCLTRGCKSKIKAITIGKRNSFYCPKCQPKRNS